MDPQLQYAQSNQPTNCATSVYFALVDLGNRLYRAGQHGDAMNMFDAAHLVMRNPLSLSAMTKQVQWGRNRLGNTGSSNERNCVLLPQPADIYQEDECDVGPRAFREPMLLPATETVNISLAEAFILYNKALIAHSRFDFVDAMQLYKSVVQILSNFVPASLPMERMAGLHPTLVHLGMLVNNNLGQIAYIEGSEEAALSYFEAAMIFARLTEVTDDALRLATATVLSNWCRVHWMTGNMNDNVYNALCEVLHIRSSVLERNHTDVASSHYNLGVAEYARRNNKSATSHLMQYLQVAAQVQHELDPIPALVYILLVKNEDKEGDATAQELVRGLRTLQDRRNDLGPQNPEIASVLNFIGTLLFHMADYDHALLFFQEELRLEELFVTGKDDVSVSVTCNNIGRILQELQRLPEAIGYYNRALAKEYGEDIRQISTKSKSRPLTTAEALARNENLNLSESTMNLYSTVFYNLGLIQDKLGAYKEAIHAFQMSLGLRRVMLGVDHADVACLLYNIGVLQMEQQLLRDATESFREALRIRRVAATGQLNDVHVVKTLQKLASLHKAKGSIEGALEAAKEILHIQTSIPSLNGRLDSISRAKEIGATLREMSELYHAQGNINEAVVEAKKSIAVLFPLKDVTPECAEYVPGIVELSESLLLLGSLHHENCQPAQAFRLFHEATAIVCAASKQTAHSSTLGALADISRMLATCQCAPEA